MRTCAPIAIEDCKKANGINYCYCKKEKEDLAASTELRGWFTKKNEEITANNKIENIKRSLGILENNIEKEEFKKDEEHKKKRKHFQDIKEVFETKETKIHALYAINLSPIHIFFNHL